MLSSFGGAVFIGTVLGVLSGLGTGGGSLLIIYLTLVQSMPQSQARAINLLFFIPSAVIACLFRWKQGRLDMKKVLPAMVTGSICAAVFAWLGAQWDSQILRKAFGLLLLFTGARELMYRQKKQ